MVKKSFLVLFLFLLVVIPLISAAPKVPTNILSSGLEISYPNPYNIKFNSGETFGIRFWVYNTSDGSILTNTTTTCTYNLINSSGFNIVRLITPTQIKFGNLTNGCANCFNFNLANSNFSYSGFYEFQIRCQAGEFGGYQIGTYLVNPTGDELTIEKTILDFIMFIFLIFLFIIVLIGVTKLPSGNDRDESGQLMSINNLKYFRSVLLFIAWLLLIAMLFITSNLATAYLSTNLFFKLLFSLYRICMGLTLPIIIVWVVWIFAQIIDDKRMRRLIEHGIYEGKGGNW